MADIARLGITIVGSGIIGLSVAEYFSKKYPSYHIKLFSNEHIFAGSLAAAANLATKGQVFGRDAHFQIKLEAKKRYRSWLCGLLSENQSNTALDSIFRQGLGIDFFPSVLARDKHFTRVSQSAAELLRQNLPLDFIEKKSETGLLYKDEMWVDAAFLLELLKGVLKKRGVEFYFGTFTKEHFLSLEKNEILILCTGAWTKTLLQELDFPLPIQMMKQERLTWGSTFRGQNIFECFSAEFVLQDKMSFSPLGRANFKVTFSGNERKQFVSSSTQKIEQLHNNFQKNPVEFEKLEYQNKSLLAFARQQENNAPFLKKHALIQRQNGFRVGYGHSEIVIEKILHQNIFVAAGAHKSGFLFAPLVGELIEKLRGLK